MTFQNRWIRYGAPVALIIVTILVAAVDTGHVGNDVQVAGTAIGLVWLIGLLGRDMGMGTSSGRRRHVPDPPAVPGPSAGPPPSRNGSDQAVPPSSPS